MRALLLIAHGSRRKGSNDEVRDLAAKLDRLSGDRFDHVAAAFLELAEPDIPTGVDLCIEAGATTVTAVPYFLAAGRHVVSDIPGELGKSIRKHPNVAIHQSEYLGKDKDIPELLLKLALNAMDTDANPESARATA